MSKLCKHPNEASTYMQTEAMFTTYMQFSLWRNRFDVADSLISTLRLLTNDLKKSIEVHFNRSEICLLYFYKTYGVNL